MSRTFIRQDKQIRPSIDYDDTVVPSEADFETDPTHIEDDLNNLRSQVHNLLKDQAGNWWDDLNVPTDLETGLQRGVNDLNGALHLVEKKRRIREVKSLVDVAVPASSVVVVLGVGELPSQITAAVGVVTTLGTVVAVEGAFGTVSLSEVAGLNALSPKNLVEIVDGNTGEPILRSVDSKRIWGLLQSESSTDGHTITDSSPTRVQISFVLSNSSNDDLEIASGTDIGGRTINYCYRERIRSEDIDEADYLDSAAVGVGEALRPGQATAVGQVLMSVDGVDFSIQQPLTSCNGWLVNTEGISLVCG